jgi:hypothetical protein
MDINNISNTYRVSPILKQQELINERKQKHFEELAKKYSLTIGQVESVYQAIEEGYRFSPEVDVWKATEEALTFTTDRGGEFNV